MYTPRGIQPSSRIIVLPTLHCLLRALLLPRARLVDIKPNTPTTFCLWNSKKSHFRFGKFGHILHAFICTVQMRVFCIFCVLSDVSDHQARIYRNSLLDHCFETTKADFPKNSFIDIQPRATTYSYYVICSYRGKIYFYSHLSCLNCCDIDNHSGA